jgi:hypothetical protein
VYVLFFVLARARAKTPKAKAPRRAAASHLVVLFTPA